MKTRTKKCPDCGGQFEAESAAERFCEDCANAYNDDANAEMGIPGDIGDVGSK